MYLSDFVRLAGGAVTAHRLRSFLTGLGIAVGIAAVVLLTSIGEGIHRFVVDEFTQFGTNLVAVNPGKVGTHGASLGIFGTVRPLTLDDARALERVPATTAVMGAVQGNAEVEAVSRSRRTTVLGVGPETPEIFRFPVAQGRFLPADDPARPRAFAVLGAKLAHELYGARSPLGSRVRVGGHRFRVIGVMAAKGQILGFDLDDTVYIPTAKALELFDREGLMEIDVLYDPRASVDEVAAGIRRVLEERHGRQDFTITTQQQMLETLSSVLNVLTLAVGALGGISLLVGAVGIFTIMTIAVSERTGEIGLLRALGARRRQILALFLGEAIVLAALGGGAGLLIGAGGAWLLGWAVPAIPVHTPWSYAVAAEGLAAAVGLAAGVLPARRAARLDPVTALRTE
ncbi:MAG TPA: ABC transporter permease [Gammaproteobacteria bacterium]|nr:ABC transporter permease [Gammaproteobacteria bacterium]